MPKPDVSEIGRKRSPNFTKKENRVLGELIQVYGEQIECRKTDHASNIGKLRAWQELSNDFNARLGGEPFRSATVLKHRYENIKKDSRRDLRKKHRGTNTDNQNSQINPLENVHSFINSSNSEDTEIENEVDIKEIIRVKLMSDDTMDQEEFDKFAQSLSNESTTLSFTKPKVETEKLPETVCWTNNSTPEFEELQRKCFSEEHKLRLQHMKEKHNLELELMRLDHKERTRMLRQEHDTKMELLELERSVGIINKI